MASPPKPWERNRAAGTATSSPALSMASSDSPAAAATADASAASAAPAVPPMPASLTTSVNQNAAAYSRLGTATSALGSPYGGAYGSTYSSPYRYGGYGGYGAGAIGGGMYGGGMYGGGYGGGMYGGGMYGGGMGMRDPNDPNSLTNRFNTNTQATFQMLEGIVGAFGGFAQMLESTYMATHSSFFAMVSVAEQFGNLRDTLGSILGIFTLMRWIRTLIAKITGRPPPADAMALTPAAFARFEGRTAPPGPDGTAGAPKPSRKPLFFFVLAAFGLPYLMSKMIKSLAASHEEEERRQMALQQQQQQALNDPSKLDFCRVLYDYTPDPALVAQQQQLNLQQQQAGGAASNMPSLDLAVKRDDLVVVLGRTDPLGNPSDWWQCRTRDGRVGYLPSTYLRVMPNPAKEKAAAQQPQQQLLPAPPSAPSVAGSVSTSNSGATTVAPASATGPDPVMAEKAAAQKAAGADTFMKSAFYQS
ncbi:peroxin-13 [Sporothrix schenckii 1099-18]|uniref:Peroxisomal membrane protein PEX13 n=1 Tax=Sporothrix schenckii 1099-18 TaxID=1397361 RepID=A0A0F2M9Y2_SPOSC|nr:peroxin-13 [Sporothrix schenckii 1099-18]KJR85635.1 peroxin-13 [Sporothrix schenckii 1099-18]